MPPAVCGVISHGCRSTIAADRVAAFSGYVVVVAVAGVGREETGVDGRDVQLMGTRVAAGNTVFSLCWEMFVSLMIAV